MNGPEALIIAFVAGIVSFLSPCTLPLLPGYLSYISGLSAEEVRDRANTRAVVGPALLFVFGFSLVFTALGAQASYIGTLFAGHRDILNRAAGVFIVLMALFMLGVFRIPALFMEKRFHVGREAGMWSSLLLGMAFAIGWSPCIGPTLSIIYTYAMTVASVQKGALLLFIYSLGLGLPFLLAALFAERILGSLGWFKRHYMAINRVGGTVLLVMGVFLLMDQWTQFLSPVMRWYANFSPPV
ncbi:MAG TPA: cytochrome c biogenesis protein CcdA [Chloroflexota bacterium]